MMKMTPQQCDDKGDNVAAMTTLQQCDDKGNTAMT